LITLWFEMRELQHVLSLCLSRLQIQVLNQS
jgi:hypothetical protein